MADKKISALTASTTPLGGTEVLPIVQSGATVKVSVANLTAGRAVSASSLTASTDNVIIGTTAKGVTTGSAIPLGLGVNNTVTAMTIDTAGNVGIGTTAPTVKLQVAGGIASVTTDGTYQLSLIGTSKGLRVLSDTNNFKIEAVDSTLSASYQPLYLGGSIIQFAAGASEQMRLDASGNVGIGTVSPSEKLDVVGKIKLSDNVVIGTAAKGIDFSANTHAAGMTSELLNWYEEGAWTATMIGSTAAPTTPVTTTGYYTRVGNIVHVFAYFANVTTTGATGDLQVTGLPFVAGSARAFGAAALDKFVLTGVQAFAAVYNGDNKVIFSENVNGGYGPNVAIPSTTGVYAQFSITYQV